MSQQTSTAPAAGADALTALLAVALAPFTAILSSFGKVAVTLANVGEAVSPVFTLASEVGDALDKVLAVMLARFYTDNPFTKRGYKVNKAKLYKVWGVDDAHARKGTLDRIFSNFSLCYQSKLPEVQRAVAGWAKGEYVTPLQTAYRLVIAAREAERDAKAESGETEADANGDGSNFSPMGEADIVKHILAHDDATATRIIATVQTALAARAKAAAVDAKLTK